VAAGGFARLVGQVHAEFAQVSVLRRPDFTTTVHVPYEQWLADNEDSLRSWYIATSEWMPEQHPNDYAEFCACQFDIACELDAQLTDGLYETMLAESDAEDSPNEEAP